MRASGCRRRSTSPCSTVSAPSRAPRSRRAARCSTTSSSPRPASGRRSRRREGSLLATVDRTLTGPGARLLAERLAAPLTDKTEIERRLDLVQLFVERPAVRERVREALRRTPDIERALQRLSVGRGGPRDLAALRDGLESGETLADSLRAEPEALLPPPAPLADIVLCCTGHRDTVAALAEALADEPPLLVRDGGFVRQGYRPELDEQRTLRDDSRKTVAGLEAKYRASSGVP